jgi:hypothetical protein
MVIVFKFFTLQKGFIYWLVGLFIGCWVYLLVVGFIYWLLVLFIGCLVLFIFFVKDI